MSQINAFRFLGAGRDVHILQLSLEVVPLLTVNHLILPVCVGERTASIITHVRMCATLVAVFWRIQRPLRLVHQLDWVLLCMLVCHQQRRIA